jgi:hypothetical protein
MARGLLQQRHQARERRDVIKRIPDRHCQTSSGSEDSYHLAKGLAPVREEHESKLAHDGIEGLIREW